MEIKVEMLVKIVRRSVVVGALFVAAAMPAAYAAGQDTVIMLGPAGPKFEEFARGFTDELGSGFAVIRKRADSATTPEQVAGWMRGIRPRAVMLLDNKAINLFQQYQRSLPPDSPAVPSVSCMGVCIGKAIRNLRNAAGISYETPLVTSAVGLRAVAGCDLRTVGILARPFMDDLIEANRPFCKKEQIDLVTKTVDDHAGDLAGQLRSGLAALLDKGAADALWIPNDIVLLRPELLRDVWIPAIRKYRKPVIVGVESLVNPDFSFGTICVSPDHVALGSQAAQLVADLREKGWLFPGPVVEQPLAVFKVFNNRQGKEIFKGRKLRLEQIDKVME